MNFGALIHFISEMKDMKSHNFVGIWENSKKKQTLKLQFNYFQKQKKKRLFDYYNIFTIGIVIIEYHINVFRVYYHSIPLSTSYYFEKVHIVDFSFQIFLMYSQLSSFYHNMKMHK